MANVFSKIDISTKEAYTFVADLENSAEDYFVEIIYEMDEVYAHTYERYIHKLDKLYDKVKSGSITDRVKIINNIVKAVESTIMKWACNDKLGSILNSYLSKYFEKREFVVGQKLSDEDWSYIEDHPLTDDNAPHNIVSKVYNNAYSIAYYDEDDDEVYKRIIPASIVFGK